MAFSRPKAIGGLAVDNDYRDDAQSASVVCRNQLWNPFSVVFVLRAGARSDVSVAQPWFRLSVEQFDMLHYAGMSIFKIGILLLNLVPYIALHIVRRA
jgi:hypothetical protein